MADDRGAENPMSAGSLVCGLTALALSPVPGLNLLAFPLGVIAAVFGGWAYTRPTGRAMACAAWVAGLLGILIAGAFWIVWADLAAEIARELDDR